MSPHVLLNILSKLRKRDEMRGLPSILSLLCNELNKFNTTGAEIIYSIYHMALNLIKNSSFGVIFQTSRFPTLLRNDIMDTITIRL